MGNEVGKVRITERQVIDHAKRFARKQGLSWAPFTFPARPIRALPIPQFAGNG
jgi:hypothetical protein